MERGSSAPCPLGHQCCSIASATASGLLVKPSVVLAHRSLQLGELADGLRREIRLAVARGVAEMIRTAERDGDRLDAAQLVADRLRAVAELRLKHDAVEFLVPVVERVLLVLGEKELRVGEARRQDFFVAVRDHRRIVDDRRRQRRELRRELAVRIFEREVALVRAHRGDDHLLGHFQKRRIEAPGDADRPLAEVRDFGDQRVIGPHAQLRFTGEPLELVDDDRAALVGIDDHVRAAQRLDVRARAGELVPAGRQEAMAAALATGRLAGPLERHDLAAEQRDEPLHRPHELGVAPTPGHRLRPRDAARELAEQRRQQLARFFAGDVAPRDRVQALLARDLLLVDRARVAGQPVLRGEPLACFGQRAVGRERRRHRRADDDLVELRLAIRERVDDHRESPRRAERLDLAVREPRVGELLRDRARQIDERLRQHLGRNLFAADLE